MIDGIYILRTRRDKDLGLEYRIYSGSKNHTIYKTLDENGKWVPDKEAIQKLFGSSPIYDDHTDVMRVAIKLSEKHNLNLIDGIVDITSFGSFTFKELVNVEIKNTKST